MSVGFTFPSTGRKNAPERTPRTKGPLPDWAEALSLLCPCLHGAAGCDARPRYSTGMPL